jgi:hypothetical protein
MPPIDALIAPLLTGLAALAVVLGVLAKVLAVRLLMDLDRAANDPVYRRSHRTRNKWGQSRLSISRL